MPTAETMSYFCAVCRKFFDHNKQHVVIPARASVPVDGGAEGDRQEIDFAPMKNGSASSVHVNCYPQALNHEKEVAGAWPDDGTFKRAERNSMVDETIFVIDRDVVKEREDALTKRGA